MAQITAPIHTGAVILFRIPAQPAARHVIINQTDSLHIGIDNRTACELKASFFQILADLIGKGRRCGDLRLGPKMMSNRLVIHAGPEVGIEASVFFLYPDEGLGIGDRCMKLQTIANNPGILQQLL